MALNEKVLAKKPWATLSIKRSDIINLREYKDEDGQKYVFMRISDYAKIYRNGRHYIGLYIPGSIEEISKILEGLG